MEIIVVSAAALLASALTLFSGFGLGTLLMPVVAIFFSVEVAIGITAIVHLANNLFKLVLLGREANLLVTLRFGAPAVIFAFIGALTLAGLSSMPDLFSYQAFGYQFNIVPLKLIVGVLILLFVLLELSPQFAAMSIERKYLPLGGVVSGFFGGLSGHQGAFRSMFLIKSGITKQEYIATGVVLAVLVDVARMMIYGWEVGRTNLEIDWPLVVSACLAAFLGAFLGARLVKKVTIRSIQLLVSVMLAVVAVGLIFGVL